MNEAGIEFREGDRVELIEEMGPLPAGTFGYVVEVYGPEEKPADAEYLRDSEWPTDSEFAVAVAFHAGLATGVWSGLNELSRTWASPDHFEPAMDPELRSTLLAGWRDAVRRTLAD